ncbi:protein WVD2-like 4 [Rosa sericea]
MGDSSCLMRSFSGPSERSGEVKEGDLLRCLGESVSFGRYASEPLDWEKWSTFSHNRYLEEVEKFSKPGSVAQKKAYFEAHYKKKAAEKAAALAEVANTCDSKVSESVTMHKSCQSSSVNMELANGESQMVEENIVPSTEVVYSGDVNDHNPDVEGTQLENAKVDGAEAVIQESVTVEDAIQVEVENSIQDEMDTSIQVQMESSTQVEISNQFENDQKEIVNGATQEEKMPNKEAASEENLASTSKKRSVNSSPSRLSTQCRASKIQYFPAKQLAGVPTGKKNNSTPKSKNSEADLVDKRRSTKKSLHMSINFSSHAGETSKRTSPVLEKIKNLRVDATALNVPVKNSASLQTATRASVNGVLKQSSVNPWSKDRRAKTVLNKSVTGSVAADGVCKSPSKDQSLAANGSKPRGPIKSCPFSLRSEERAAKRKEFFQRLEEKKNGEAESKQLPMRSNKEKAVNDVKKLRQSTGLKAKDLSSGSQLLNNKVKKVPPTRSQSQKLERQSTTSKVLDPSTRPSVNSHSSKHVTQKYNPRTSQSVTSLPKKNAHENSSPNIQS